MIKTWLKRGRSQDDADATQRAAELKDTRVWMDKFLDDTSKFLTENLKKISEEQAQMDKEKQWLRHSTMHEIPKDVFGSMEGLEEFERKEAHKEAAWGDFRNLKDREVELDELIRTEVIKPVLERKKEVEEGLPKNDYTKIMFDDSFYVLPGIIGKSGANRTIVERAIFWLIEEMEDEQVAGELCRIVKKDLGIILLPSAEGKDAKRI